MDHDHALLLGATGLLDKLVQIVRIACQENDRTYHPQCGSSDHSVDCAAVAGEARDAKEFSGCSSDLGADRMNQDSRQHSMYSGVTRTTAQDFSERDGADGCQRTTSTRRLVIPAHARVSIRKFRQALAVENERPSCRYWTSGHAALASAMNSSGTGPWSSSSRSLSSAMRSSWSCLATASVTY